MIGVFLMNKDISFNPFWEEKYKTNWGSAYPSEDVIRFVARNFYATTRRCIRILDFGCGTGSNTAYLAREGFDVYAFDGSDAAVNKARELLAQQKLNANIMKCDAIDISYDTEMFDAVIDNAVIYSNITKNIVLMYKKIFNILKINGKMLTTSLFTKNTTGFDCGKCIEKNTYVDIMKGPLSGGQVAHCFEKSEIITMLTEIGFKNLIIDVIRRTDHNGEVLIEYFNVIAEKR